MRVNCCTIYHTKAQQIDKVKETVTEKNTKASKTEIDRARQIDKSKTICNLNDKNGE